MKKLFCLLLAALLCAAPCLAETTMIANPWTDTDAENFVQLVGFELNLPEDAENVVWRVLESEGLGEVQFTWQEMEYTARIQSTAEFEDISGMYYDWAIEEPCTIDRCEGVTRRTTDGDMTVDLCLWYDIVPGVMYSVTASAPDLDGFDIEAIANILFVPMQDEA